MIEIPRFYQQTFTYQAPNTSVPPVHAIVSQAPNMIMHERRNQERRRQAKKPVIERRVSADRRGPLFDAEA
ncbi:hypothetical protein Q7C_229 [Methylophaga frappieri]|uniref:Uncharacterized protein n=1 Tax=Methylophaga frappieri (strain ATCC BAA-2434 / DSM 25690 / JAM7) TaxID=754477 RepID=I1YER5_METFJ|nr:hypothetical protein [Methylophaga frappieri]AFJ01408.1 hypothetical protein Q7C_229 [Methylophaga frappieri]